MSECQNRTNKAGGGHEHKPSVCALCSIRGNICRQHLLTCAVEAMGIPGWDRSTWYKVERVGLVYREREKKCGRGVEAA